MRIALALAFAVCGCSKADLSDFAFVEGLRILGAQAEPPEVAPGNTTTLTAWVVDTHAGDAVGVTWSACMLPSSGLANPACTDGSGNGLVPLGSGETISIVVPPVDAANLGAPDITGGVYLPIVIHVTGRDDATDAVYRLRIAGDLPRNNNPTFTNIEPLRDDGVPELAVSGVTWGLVAHYGGNSVESYQSPASAPDNIDERLTTQWFATAGSFPDQPVGGTAVQSFKLDRALPPSGGTIDLWVVGHDERGGSTMLHRSFVMQ